MIQADAFAEAGEVSAPAAPFARTPVNDAARMVSLRDYQIDAVEQARQHIRDGKKNILIVAPTGSGKCLGRDTPVLMFDGTVKPVQEVRAGELLMGPDSRPRKVLSTARGIGPLYRVAPTRGDSYVVNDAHILSLKMTAGGAKGDCSKSDTYKAGKVHNITVTDYLSRSATFRHCAKGWRAAVDFQPSGDLPLPAYFLGAWLGDGNSKGPAICSADLEVIYAVRELAAEHALSTRGEVQAGNKATTVHITGGWTGGRLNSVTAALRELDVLHNKHIPRVYLTASRKDRLELLAGLIDTDGSLSGGGFDFIQKNKQLSLDVAFLARSLGLAAYVSECNKTCGNNGKQGVYWRVSISGDCSGVPTRLPRKRAPKRVMNKDVLLVGLTVEEIGSGEYFGFEIDGDRLFMLGDFTVTHNTVIAAFLIEAAMLKGHSAIFLVDRVSLVEQTSQTFDRYGIDHGIMQADHWRWRPALNVQLVSVHTVAKRKWPLARLLIVDEAHTVNETTRAKITLREIITIGLTATPFTKGLGKLYDAVVNVTTTNRLIEQGFLSPYSIYSCAQPDMEGVKIVAGEYDEKETSKRALQVVGDVVAEYRMHGQDRKFICSAVDVAHVEELARQFTAAGIVVATYTYKDRDEDRADVLAEFRKPGTSTIKGLITVTAATKGFDVEDIGCVIMARPLRSSLAEFIQLLGRGLRTSPSTGKTDCLVLCHSGNCARFWHAFREFFENGLSVLDDGKKKPKPKKKPEEEVEPMECPQCKHMHTPRPVCPQCGHEYPKKGAIEHVPGTLTELIASGTPAQLRLALWPQVCGYVAGLKVAAQLDAESKQRRAQAIYHELTKGFAHARFDATESVTPTPEVLGKIKQNQIAFAKRRQGQKAGRGAA